MPKSKDQLNLIYLRRYSKVLCAITLALIFLGGLVKSMEAGLSVPDWPTTYGHFMFSFPLNQMVGGIKYEHTHRMLASVVGLMTLVLCVWLYRSKVALYIKRLGLAAFLTVVAQGVLGGLTVKYFLPVSISTFHGVLAQTFLLIVIMIAYSLSVEHSHRWKIDEEVCNSKIIKCALILCGMVYVQLFLGNLMRHTNSGLAVPDFPTMGGSWLPTFDHAMLDRINAWRFHNNLDPVTMGQVHIHILHRVWALLILLKLMYLNHVTYRDALNRPLILKTVYWINIAVIAQIILGISTVLSAKEVYTTTLHVTTGAIVLSLTFLLVLRAAPLTWRNFRENLSDK